MKPGPKIKHLSEEQKTEIRNLRGERMSYYNIFLELNIPEDKVRNYCQEVGLSQNMSAGQKRRSINRFM